MSKNVVIYLGNYLCALKKNMYSTGWGRGGILYNCQLSQFGYLVLFKSTISLCSFAISFFYRLLGERG